MRISKVEPAGQGRAVISRITASLAAEESIARRFFMVMAPSVASFVSAANLEMYTTANHRELCARAWRTPSAEKLYSARRVARWPAENLVLRTTRPLMLHNRRPFFHLWRETSGRAARRIPGMHFPAPCGLPDAPYPGNKGRQRNRSLFPNRVTILCSRRVRQQSRGEFLPLCPVYCGVGARQSREPDQVHGALDNCSRIPRGWFIYPNHRIPRG